MLRQFAFATLLISTLGSTFDSTIALPRLLSAHANSAIDSTPEPIPNPAIPNSAIPNSAIPNSLITIIQKDIQTRWRVPAKTLSVKVTQRRTWDLCMGIPPISNQCGEMAIPGWQVIIQGNSRYWVYNTDNSGKRLAYNAIASQPRPAAGTVTPGLINPLLNPQAIVPIKGENIIFQSAMVSGEVLAYSATTLSEDGTIRRRIWNRDDHTEIKPIILKKITSNQVQQFKKILSDNRFSHFDRMSYLNPNAMAVDAGSLQFSGLGTVTEYTLGTTIPKNLTSIADAWAELMKDLKTR